MEKKTIKVSLSTFFLIIAIIVIAVMGYFMYKLYNDKAKATKEATDLQTQVNTLNRAINDLQGKIDTISETLNTNKTSENATVNEGDNSVISKKYDVEITPSDVANIYKEWQNNGNDMNVFKKFNNKYIGKIIKVTGIVDYYEISNRVDYDYCINLGDKNLDRVYATCLTNNKEMGLKEGQKITVIGTYMDDPNIMTLKDIKVIE